MSRALLGEVLVFEHLLAQPPRVLGQAQRGIRTLPLRQVDRIDRRVADRHRRVFRIDVDGRHVEFELGLGAQQQEAADTANRACPAGREIAPESNRCTSPCCRTCEVPLILSVARSGAVDRYRERQSAAVRVPDGTDASARAVRTRQRCRRAARGALRRRSCVLDPSRRARRVMGKRPLRAAQVGNAHGRQLHAAELLGRKRDRHAEDAVEDAVAAENAPERLTLAEQPHVGLAADRNRIGPQPIRRGARCESRPN